MESLVALRDRRELVIARLSESYAADLFDLDELDRRLDLAHAARSVAELDQLIADLAPAPKSSTALVVAGSQAPEMERAGLGLARAIDDPARAATKQLRVIMSSIERRGRWLVPTALDARVFWGSSVLDFREASIGPGVTTIEVRVTMGSLEIILPPWLSIDVDVSSFAGSVEERHRVPPDADPSRPLLRVTGRVRFGSLEISTRLPGESASDARKRWKRDRKQLTAGKQM